MSRKVKRKRNYKTVERSKEIREKWKQKREKNHGRKARSP